MKDINNNKIRGIHTTIINFDAYIMAEKVLELCDELLQADSIDIEDSKILFTLLSNFNDCNTSLSELSKQFIDISSNQDDFSSNIPALKKRIKYCKNPLERKNLEKQLNAAYKTMKKRR